MPRLPTMRVIGSHDISRTSLSSVSVCAGASWILVIAGSSPVLLVAGRELALVAPLGFLLDGLHRDATQPANDRAVAPDRRGGDLAARGFVHERHELVGEARFGAADADAADVRA